MGDIVPLITIKECHFVIIIMRKAIFQDSELLCHWNVNAIDTQWLKKLTLGCHSDLDLHQNQCSHQGKSRSPVWCVAIQFTSLLHRIKLLMKRHSNAKVNKRLTLSCRNDIPQIRSFVVNHVRTSFLTVKDGQCLPRWLFAFFGTNCESLCLDLFHTCNLYSRSLFWSAFPTFSNRYSAITTKIKSLPPFFCVIHGVDRSNFS